MPPVEEGTDRSPRLPFQTTGDELISAYLRPLDPLCVVLIGAFDFSERLVGLAEAHAIAGTECARLLH